MKRTVTYTYGDVADALAEAARRYMKADGKAHVHLFPSGSGVAAVVTIYDTAAERDADTGVES